MTMKNKKGVDISTWQGDIDLAKVKAAGYDFVMIRCGWGTDSALHDDDRFVENVRKAEKLGMPWGVYLFSYACSADEAKSEVAHVDRLLKAEAKKGYRPTFPVAIDIEWTEEVEKRGGWNAKNLTTVATVFLDGVKKLGYYPMIYTGGSELKMMDAHIRDDFDCWFAQWYTQPSDYHYKRLGIWQYGGEENYLESNNIPGVGVIDKDLCYKDYPTIIKQGGYNGWAKDPTPTPTPTPTPKKEKTVNLTFNYLGRNYVSPTGQTRTVQRILNTCNYKGADGKKLAEDGVFGVNTEYAVKAYQTKHKLAVDGVVGAATWKALTGAK